MTYYHTVRKAFKYLETVATAAVKEDKELDANLVYYAVLERHPISRKAVFERLAFLADTMPGLNVAKLPEKYLEVEV
jgi:hypothetical protein